MAASDRDFREELTQRIIDQLEAGTAPWIKPWEARLGDLPFNPTTGKPYRGANSLYLSMSGYSDPRWATYKQAQEKGWQVRKGEKGSWIEYWQFTEQKKVLDGQGKPVKENGKIKTITVKLDKPRVFHAVVFNLSQMDNVPEYKLEDRKYEWDPVERAEQILAASGAKIYHDQFDGAYYSPAHDDIHMPDKGQFPTVADYYGTALHELGHWTGHASRLNRDLTGGFGSEKYAKEELRAELSSYFLAEKLGIPHKPERHASYIQSWLRALKEDKNEIFRAARDAEKIVDYVLSLDRQKELASDKEEEKSLADTLDEYVTILAQAKNGERPMITAEQRDKMVAITEEAFESRTITVEGDDPLAKDISGMLEPHQRSAMQVARALADFNGPSVPNPFKNEQLSKAYASEHAWLKELDTFENMNDARATDDSIVPHAVAFDLMPPAKAVLHYPQLDSAYKVLAQARQFAASLPTEADRLAFVEKSRARLSADLHAGKEIVVPEIAQEQGRDR